MLITETTRKKNAKPLPSKLSDLLDVAVDDCIKVSKFKSYRFNMFWWYRRDKNTCTVCMAGAVMACRLIRGEGSVHPFAIDSVTDRGKIFAINHMRTGNVFGALGVLGNNNYDYNTWEQLGEICDLVKKDFNQNTGRAHWRTYRRAAKKLRALGL